VAADTRDTFEMMVGQPPVEAKPTPSTLQAGLQAPSFKGVKRRA
jgi:hypothetical protein